VFWDHYVTWGAELHSTIKPLAVVSNVIVSYDDTNMYLVHVTAAKAHCTALVLLSHAQV
jgi:hypothetical protein